VKLLGRVLEGIANLGGYFSGWLVLVMVVLVFAEVFTRYVMGQPLMLADEFSGYMFVALSFLGAAYAWKKGGHVRLTALVTRLPTRVASWLRLVTLSLVFLFVLGLCQASYGFMATSFKLHMASITRLHTPLQIPHMTVAIGFVILSLVLIVGIARAIVNIRAGKSAEEATR